MGVGLSVLAVVMTAVAPAAAAAAPAARAESYTFAFRDADIAQVAEEILGATLGVSYTIDPSVTGRMSFRIDRRLTRPQLLEAFEAALANSGVVMIRQGESVLLTTRAAAKGAGGVRSAPRDGARAGYEVVAAPLSHAIPSEVAKLLESVGPKDVVVHADDKTGTLLIGGTPREIEAALETIRTFDQSGVEGARIRWFELAQGSAPVLARELNQMLQASGATGASVVPLRRLNGLIAFARTPSTLDEIGRWVQRLDRVAGAQSNSLWVYHPRNVSAESLGRTLASVMPGGAGMTSAPTSAPTSGSTEASAAPTSTVPVSGGSGNSDEDAVRIGVDKESNALLVSASPAQRVEIQRILEEIDITPSQVLIEASILEVTLNNDFRLGVNWSILGADGKLAITKSSANNGTVAPTFPGFAVTFLDDDIKAAIDALGSRTNVEVMSNPKIVAVNNRTASLQIGDQVPVVVQTAQGNETPNAPRVVNVEYRDTGVILNVTPRVSGEDSIMLTVAQEVSSVAKTSTSGIDSPTIQQRKLESTLMLRDGATVALGGLISSNRGNGDSGVPYLKDVPVVGNLFKSQSRDHRRTELIVLITARVMRSEETSKRVMDDLKADMREIGNRGLFSAQ